MAPVELRAAPLRRSLFRTQTVLGGERGPMLLVIVMSSLLIFSGMTLFSFVAGGTIMLAGVHGLRAAAKLHPQASKVYVEFLKYRRYYPARTRHPLPMPHRAAARLGRRPPARVPAIANRVAVGEVEPDPGWDADPGRASGSAPGDAPSPGPRRRATA